MKDYKGRGSNLSFGEPRRKSKLLPLVVVIAVVAAAIYYGLDWYEMNGERAAEAPPRGASDHAIPLTLPPAPASTQPPAEDTTE